MIIFNNKRFFRRSRDSDFNEIKSLLIMCFGNRFNTNAYDHIDGRYLLCIIDNKIVAMSGFCYKSDVDEDAIEMSWTCTHPNYRHQGIMQEIFAKLLNTTDEPIYCFCWKINDNDMVNLHSLMDMFNFKLYKSNINPCKHDTCVNNDLSKCVYYSSDCKCCQDLYRRDISI